MADLDLQVKVTALTNSAIASMSKLNGATKRLGASLETAGRSLTGLTTLIGGGLFFREIIKDASDAEEGLNKFGVVFSDVIGEANKASKELAENFGLSRQAAVGLLSDTGDLLTGFGFGAEQALELSTQVQELGVDLASFTNFSGGAEGASQALTKALLGETESLKSLGISIKQDAVNKRIQEKAAQGVAFATEQQAKAQVTLELALEQSKNAIGDFARSQDSFANQTRILTASLQDASTQLGALLLPLVTKAVNKFSDLIKQFSNSSKETKILVVSLAALAVGIGPLLIVLGKFLTIGTSILTLLKALSVQVLRLSALLTPVTGTIIAVGVALADIIGRVKQLKNLGVGTADSLKLVFLDFAIFVQDLLKKGNSFLSEYYNNFSSFVERLSRGTINLGNADFQAANEENLAILENQKQALLEKAKLSEEDIEGLKSGFGAGLQVIADDVKALLPDFSQLKDDFVGLFGEAKTEAEALNGELGKTDEKAEKTKPKLRDLRKELSSSAPRAAASGLTTALGNIASGAETAKNSFKDFARSFLSNIAQMISEAVVFNAIQTAVGSFSAGGKATKSPVQTKASGGAVFGAGTATSDSIPAMLSNGEYVIKAETARSIGYSALDAINNLGKRAKNVGFKKGISKFATGGQVGVGSDFINRQSQAPFSINLQNSGSEKEATDVTTEETVRGTVINIMLEDMQRNGPITQSQQRVFGLKRGGNK